MDCVDASVFLKVMWWTAFCFVQSNLMDYDDIHVFIRVA